MIKYNWIAKFEFYVNTFIEIITLLNAVLILCINFVCFIQRTTIYIENHPSILFILIFIILFSIELNYYMSHLKFFLRYLEINIVWWVY